MLPIDSLFLLIHSLSKSEKRYFKLTLSMQKGDKEYLRLFDLLEDAVSYDEAKKELATLFPGATIEPARKHLYKNLMKSLRQFEADKQIDVRLMNLLRDSIILFDRGLVDPALEQIEKAKSLALQHEKFLFFIMCARQELQYMIRLQFAGLNESALIEKQVKMEEILKHESILQQHSSLYEVLLLRYWENGEVRSVKEITRLNDLLLEEHQVLNSQHFQTFESQQLHLHFQSVYFLMTGDPTESLKVFRELDALFLKNAHLWTNTPLYYIHLLTGILNTLRRLEQYDEMAHFLDRLRSVSNISENLALSVTYHIFEYELHCAIHQKQFKQALALVEARSDVLNREVAQLPIQAQTQIWLTLSQLWYGVGDYSKALKLINRVLNQSTNSFNRTLYVSCRLMNLLIHAALDNTDYLYYEIRSIERKLKAEQNLFQVEKLVIKILKNWLKNKPIKEIVAQITSLMDDPFEQQLIIELGLKDWAYAMAAKGKTSKMLR